MRIIARLINAKDGWRRSAASLGLGGADMTWMTAVTGVSALISLSFT